MFLLRLIDSSSSSDHQQQPELGDAFSGVNMGQDGIGSSGSIIPEIEEEEEEDTENYHFEEVPLSFQGGGSSSSGGGGQNSPSSGSGSTNFVLVEPVQQTGTLGE